MIVEERRRDELRRSLAEVEARIDVACERAGRDRGSVRLLPVTKNFPASDVAALMDLGLREFAENRDQEGSAKAAEIAEARPDDEVTWHMVGRLQRNKARSVLRWASRVQSVDSPRLAAALMKAVAAARADGRRDGPLDVQIQVSIDGDPDRGGCPIDEVSDLADKIAHSGGLELRGLMAVAPLGSDADAAFGVLHRVFADLRRDHPRLTDLSAGMSADLEQGIAHGATLVRVGTALLGHRELA